MAKDDKFKWSSESCVWRAAGTSKYEDFVILESSNLCNPCGKGMECSDSNCGQCCVRGDSPQVR